MSTTAGMLSASRAQWVAAALCAVVGFAAVVQVRANDDDVLERATRAELVRILDGLNQRNARLEAELVELERTRAELLTSADSQQTALEQATERTRQLGVLAGDVAAQGPGIALRIADPGGTLPAAVMLSAVQELRDAGAEAMQVTGSAGAPATGNDSRTVRIVASTYFVDGDEGIVVSGEPLRAPYRIDAIGDPSTLDTAMQIPGGLVEEVGNAGGTATIEQESTVVVDSLQPLRAPEYARPVPPA